MISTDKLTVRTVLLIKGIIDAIIVIVREVSALVDAFLVLVEVVLVTFRSFRSIRDEQKIDKAHMTTDIPRWMYELRH